MKTFIHSCLLLLLIGVNTQSRVRADITGHWSFEAADLFLSAKIGQYMLEIDNDTAAAEQFGTTGQGIFAGVPNIAGQPAAVMQFPKTPPPGGYYVPPAAAPNGGGNNINRYTIIADLLYPSASSGKVRALFQTDGGGPAEFLVTEGNQLTFAGGTPGGILTADQWHRIAIAVDLTANPAIALFIDGAKVAEGNPSSTVDGQFSITIPQFSYSALLFDNDDTGRTEVGYLNSLQFRDDRLADAVIAALGSPTAAGIPTGPLPDPYLLSITPSPDSVRIPERSTVSPLPLIQAVLADGTNAVNPSTLRMSLNGALVPAVVEPGVGQNTIHFTPTTLLTALATYTVRIDYRGADGTAYSNQWQFLVGHYQALPAGSAGPPGSGNTPGFLVRTVQAPTGVEIPAVNSFPRALKQLNHTLTDTGGVLVANVALPGPNANGSYNESLINYYSDTGDFGNFTGDTPFPGIPGSEGLKDVFATEVLAFLELTAGSHRLGVSVSVDRTDTGTDDGFTLYGDRDARGALATALGSYSRNVANPFASTYNNNEFTVAAPVDGVYSVRLVHYQTFQFASLEFYSLEPGTTNKILINDSSNPQAIHAYRFSTAPFSNKPYLLEVDPAPGVSGVSPLLPVKALIMDDVARVNVASVRLFLNGTQVPAQASRNGGLTTVLYQPNATRTEVTNRWRLIYSDDSVPTARSYTNDWEFTIVVSSQGAVAVAGQWDFDQCDLAGTVGQPLEYFDGPAGQTAAGTQFGTTTLFGIPDIGGVAARVMRVPATPNNQIGYIMRHGIPANGGGTRVNQYTLIEDIYWDTTGNGFASFINFDLSNTSDGDFFWRVADGGFGQGGGGYEGNTTMVGGRWHRVVFAVDLAANPPVVTKFLDGVKHADQLAPNNVLDGDRRSMPVGGVVLFGDGDDGERRGCYVNSIQVRAGKLSDGDIAALGGPSASGIPQAVPRTSVTGQWDFERPNLAPTVGAALEFFDGPAGQTFTGTQFGSTTSFGISDIGGVPANVMHVPGTQNNQIGYVMRHGIPANGGGSRVNQYTLIEDIYWETTGNGFASFINFDLSNTSDGDIFWRVADGGFGQGGGGYEGNTIMVGGQWHRVIFAVDMAANPPVVTKFLDGRKHADQLAPNNVLDGDRRSMPVGGAVLFGDGDDGERRGCYLNSIQVRAGKITDGEAAALGGPSARGIPVVIAATTVTGMWDFERPNLAPTVGQALEYFDGPTGQTAGGTQFGSTTTFGIADIGGVPANVMHVPGTPNNQIGYIMRHGIPANGGGTRVNQYTLIEDIYWETTGNGFASFINFDLSNTSDGDIFWRVADGGFGQGGGGYEGATVMQGGRWHRVAFAVDMAATPPVVTKFLDGVKHADQFTPNNVLDGDRRTLPVAGAVLFGDGDDGERRGCYVNSIQIRAGKLSDAELTALGGPSADGIPVAVAAPVAASIPRLVISRASNQVRIVWPADLVGYRLQGATTLPSAAWLDIPGVVANCATVPINGNYRFFRLTKP